MFFGYPKHGPFRVTSYLSFSLRKGKYPDVGNTQQWPVGRQNSAASISHFLIPFIWPLMTRVRGSVLSIPSRLDTAAVSGFSLLPRLLNTSSKSPLHWLEPPHSFFLRNIEPARLGRLFGVAWWGWEGVGRGEEGWEGKRQFMEPVGSWLPPTGTF